MKILGLTGWLKIRKVQDGSQNRRNTFKGDYM